MEKYHQDHCFITFLIQVMNCFQYVIKATDAITSKLHIHTIACGLAEDLWTLQRPLSDVGLKNPDLG